VKRRIVEGSEIASERRFSLKLPTSVKTAAAQLAKADGVSLNQFRGAGRARETQGSGALPAQSTESSPGFRR